MSGKANKETEEMKDEGLMRENWNGFKKNQV
jgi:hypothetical protein